LIPAKAIESVEAEAAKPIDAKTVKPVGAETKDGETVKVKAPVEAAGRKMREMTTPKSWAD
jgi:hypothetical protein